MNKFLKIVQALGCILVDPSSGWAICENKVDCNCKSFSRQKKNKGLELPQSNHSNNSKKNAAKCHQTERFQERGLSLMQEYEFFNL